MQLTSKISLQQIVESVVLNLGVLHHYFFPGNKKVVRFISGWQEGTYSAKTASKPMNNTDQLG